MSQITNSNHNIDELLDSLGFEEWKTVILSFILPVVNV